MDKIDELKKQLESCLETYRRKGVDANWALSREGCECSSKISELSSEIKRLENI